MEKHGVGNRFDTLENRRLKALSEQFAKMVGINNYII